MKVVFFDGYCVLCNGFVDWLLRIDRHHKLKFASLQGETAKKLLGSHSLILQDVSTIIYSREEEVYQKSSAVLRILADVGGIWVLAKVFLLIPSFLRDGIYALVAKNRYKFFGQRQTC